MIREKSLKKKRYDPKPSDLRRVLRYIILMLEPDEIKKIEDAVPIVAQKHCLSNPACWKYCVGKIWLSYRIKEILNIKAGKPVNDYRTGLLTLRNLQSLAYLVGIKDSELIEVSRPIWWQQIVEHVKKNEDSRMNRLLKLWAWFADRISDEDIDYLIVHAPGYWQKDNRDCYKNDPDWKAKHLTYIFEISYIIQEVVDAKLKSKEIRSSVAGLSSVQLWEIATEIMNLKSQLPESPTKKILWQKILEKIEADNKAQ